MTARDLNGGERKKGLCKLLTDANAATAITLQNKELGHDDRIDTTVISEAIQLQPKNHVFMPFERINMDSSSVEALFEK